MGHGDARGQELDQPDADSQPAEEDQVGWGAQAPVDLRTFSCSSLYIINTWSFSWIYIRINEFLSYYQLILFSFLYSKGNVWLLPSTVRRRLTASRNSTLGGSSRAPSSRRCWSRGTFRVSRDFLSLSETEIITDLRDLFSKYKLELSEILARDFK